LQEDFHQLQSVRRRRCEYCSPTTVTLGIFFRQPFLEGIATVFGLVTIVYA
jgi:hypothetical protein